MTKVLVQDRRIEAFPPTADLITAPIPHANFFHPDSYWRRKITDYTPYQHPTIPAANSTNWKNSLCNQMLINPTTGAWVGGNQTAFLSIRANPKVYVVPAGYPRRSMQIASYNLQLQGAGPLDSQLRDGVPAPPDLVPGGGGDNSCVVYQPSTDTLWDLYQLGKTDSSSNVYDVAAWGGIIYGVSKFKGTFTDQFRADGVQVGSYLWGGPATSISLASGMTTADEAASGVIPHAISMVVAHAQFNPILFVPPANRGDGDQRDAPGYAPEGIRITFPPGSDFSRVRPEFIPFANAIQQYGIIVTDKTGAGVALQIRDGTTAEWVQTLTLYNTDALAGWRYMSSLPWHQAVIVNPAQSQ